MLDAQGPRKAPLLPERADARGEALLSGQLRQPIAGVEVIPGLVSAQGSPGFEPVGHVPIARRAAVFRCRCFTRLGGLTCSRVSLCAV